MSATVVSQDSRATWSTQKARWFLVAVHVAIIEISPILTSFGSPGVPATGNPAIAFPLGLAILAIQLRHSFAVARGERPRGAWWTFLALVVLVYLPMMWFGVYWVSTQICVMASLPMVVHGRKAIVAAAVPVAGTAIANVVANVYGPGQAIGVSIYGALYFSGVLIFQAAGMYGSARLVRLIEDLQEARAGLAEAAIERERLRISRDLHDLLGQSLSAISLKGDLAIRLLGENSSAARAEIETLTALARSALRRLLAMSRDEHTVSLRTETEGAAALLSAAGIDSQINLDLFDLTAPLEGMLAWTVREGVANVLRHSQAQVCMITSGRRDGHVFLEIVNDGVRTPMAHGSGLRGLNERARALSGSASGSVTADGHFRLLVEVPEDQR